MSNIGYRIRKLIGNFISYCTEVSTSPLVIYAKVLDKELYRTLPRPAKEGDAGFDLKCCQDIYLAPGESALVPTGIALYTGDAKAVGFLIPRSSFSKLKCTVPGSIGVIDSGYQGEILISIRNTSTENVFIGKGDRLCQMVYLPVYATEIVQVTDFPKSLRGVEGFGSSGKN